MDRVIHGLLQEVPYYLAQIMLLQFNGETLITEK